MAIVGFTINKMLTERQNAVKGKISIKNNVSIKNVEKADLSLGKARQDGLKFSFEFSCIYEPNIGQIIIEGDVLDLQDKKDVDEALTSWKKDKKLDPTLMRNVLNTVFGRCNVQALILSRDINLPPPIPIPSAVRSAAPKQ
ncbi:hypothetical protein HYU19_02120 [Candidatus Woesearchaeota archaeon]|nr:hypothetical protein [Candidatus Woesearchaeota archaeon]